MSLLVLPFIKQDWPKGNSMFTLHSTVQQRNLRGEQQVPCGKHESPWLSLTLTVRWWFSLFVKISHTRSVSYSIYISYLIRWLSGLTWEACHRVIETWGLFYQRQPSHWIKSEKATRIEPSRVLDGFWVAATRKRITKWQHVAFLSDETPTKFIHATLRKRCACSASVSTPTRVPWPDSSSNPR